MSGVILALFVVFHLMDLTWGTAHPGFERGAIERNIVASLERWSVAIVYAVATLALGAHLVHGTWSLFTSLGFHGRRIDQVRRALVTAIPAFLVIGNLAIPVAVLARSPVGSASPSSCRSPSSSSGPSSAAPGCA